MSKPHEIDAHSWTCSDAFTSYGSLPSIIGHACRVAGASNPTQLWDLMEHGRDVRRPVPDDRFSAATFYHPDGNHRGTTNVSTGYFIDQHPGMFDASFFRISKMEAEAMDPQQRILLEVVYEALEDAGIPISRIAGSKTSVFTGSFSMDYQRLLDTDAASQPKYAATGLGKSMTSNRISHFFDLRGESIALDTACSSTLTALHLANESLRFGRSDLAIVAGSALNFHPGLFSELQDLGMLSKDGTCRAFSADANGYARGEGIAAVVLQRVRDAEKQNHLIKAVLKASAINHDGTTQGIMVPSQKAQESLIRWVYQDACLNPNDTSYFEGHGTGTTIGDQIEVNAITSVFGEKGRPEPLVLGSVKSNIGHTEGAAGLISVIKTTMALQKGLIPPNMHFKEASESVKLTKDTLQIPTCVMQWPLSKSVRRASVNSFGYGGSNAHIILEAYQARLGAIKNEALSGASASAPNPDGEPKSVLIPLSCHSESSGRRVLERLHSFISQLPNVDVPQLAHTLASRRSVHSRRRYLIAHDQETLLDGLSKPGGWTVARPRATRIGFVFTGQGALWARMGYTLLGKNEVFTNTILRCDSALRNLPNAPNWNIEEELSRQQDSSNLYKPEYSQPISVCVQIALVEVLRSWNIRPTACCGHSSGELASAYAAGILSLETVVAFAYYRGLCTSGPREESDAKASSEAKTRGTMLAVGMSEAETTEMLNEHQGRLSLAAVNSQTSCTLSGDEDVICAVERDLNDRNIFNIRLRVTQAYHSHHMKPFAQLYEQYMRNCASVQQPKQNEVRMFSAVTARLVEWKMMGPSYWVQNFLSPVRFMDALVGTVLDELDEQQVDVLLEIGPNPLLKSPSLQVLRALGKDIPYIGSLSQGVDDNQALLEMVGKLFTEGVPVDLDLVNGILCQEAMSGLPSYPWDHQKYWAASGLTEELLLHQKRHAILGLKLPRTTTWCSKWRNILRVKELSFITKNPRSKTPILTPDILISIAMAAAISQSNLKDLQTVTLDEIIIEQPYPLNSGELGTEIITEMIRLSRTDESPRKHMVSIHAFKNVSHAVELFRCEVHVQYDRTNLRKNHASYETEWHYSTVDARDISDDLHNCLVHPDLILRSCRSLHDRLVEILHPGQTLSEIPTGVASVGISKQAIMCLQQANWCAISKLASRCCEIPTRTGTGDVELVEAGTGTFLLRFESVEYAVSNNICQSDRVDELPATLKPAPDRIEDLRGWLDRAPSEETRVEILTHTFIQRLSNLTGISSTEISPASQLSNYGLDSLMANEIRNWFLTNVAVELPLGDFLRPNSIRDLIALALKKTLRLQPAKIAIGAIPDNLNAGTKLRDIPAFPKSKRIPISSFQNRLWFTQTLANDTTLFNCQLLLMLRGDVDVERLKLAWSLIKRANTVFRTAFVDGVDGPEQQILDQYEVEIPLYDISSERDSQVALNDLSRSIQAEEFELEKGNCFRLALVNIKPETHCLIFIVHHLVFDRGSCFRLLDQMTSFYEDSLHNENTDLSRWGNTKYGDFTLWHNQQLALQLTESYMEHWRSILSGSPSQGPLLPFAKQGRTHVERIETMSHRTILDPRLLGRMKRLCASFGVTAFHFLLATFMSFIYRYTEATDLVVLAVQGDRPHPNVSDIIGLFTNMLPMRLVHDYDGTMVDVIKAARTVALTAADHPAPFDEIVRASKSKVEPGVFPIGQLAINYQIHGTIPKYATSDFVVERVMTEDVPTACDLSLEAIEDPEFGLRLALEHSVALYDQKDISRFLGNFLCFLENTIKDPLQPVGEVPMTGPDELALISQYWNHPGRRSITYDLQIAARICQSAKDFPEKIACLTSDGDTITYSGLVEAAERVASRLLEESVQPCSYIGLYTLPGIQEIIGMLGILLCRSAYVALDPKFADERLNYMANDSQARVILIGDDVADTTGLTAIFDKQKLIRISEASSHAKITRTQPSQPHDPFYVTYTSGSTGKPKGVIMRQSNVTLMLAGIEREFKFGRDDRFLHQITMAFDLSVVEIWSSLLAGATLCIASADTRREPSTLTKFMAEAGVTFTYFTPTQFALLLEADPNTLKKCHQWRLAWFCGEVFPPRLAQVFHELNLPPDLYNTYGPCEAMVQATIFKVSHPVDIDTPVPIGHALPSVQHYILDKGQNPLPIGVVGELYLGGPQVGTGYLNRQHESALNFLDDPFAATLFPHPEFLGGKMFKTGDMCRLDGNNNLHFIRRKAGETLVKLRGLRIDLGEIEQSILKCANEIDAGALRNVCVVARYLQGKQDNASRLMDERQLFAFLVLRRSPESKSEMAQGIARRLRRSLNEYMVPTGYVFRPSLPTTDNGKTDRLSLLSCELIGLIRVSAQICEPSQAITQSNGRIESLASTTVSKRRPSATETLPQELKGDRLPTNGDTTATRFEKPNVQKEVIRLFKLSLKLSDDTVVDVGTNYFDLGGSSLSMMQFHNLIRRHLGSNVPLRDLFTDPTVSGISALLSPSLSVDAKSDPHPPNEAGASDTAIGSRREVQEPQISVVDWDQEISLPDDSRYRIPDSSGFDDFLVPQATDILLTGADSHQGLHVLAHLLENSGDTIHLIGTEQPLKKDWLLSRMRHYKLIRGQVTEPELLRRVRIHRGCMANRHFGFNPTEFVLLGSRTRSIINLAVSVSMLKSYSALRDVNIRGLLDLIELAACGSTASSITHLSTFSVPQLQSWHRVQRKVRHRVIADEASARSYAPPQQEEDGYVPVRWVGERILEAAAERGFVVNILRGSAMTGASSTGVPEPAVGVVQQGIMGIMMAGVAPDIPGYVADFVPVDVLASWIYALSMQGPSDTPMARFYHVTNPSPLLVQQIHRIGEGIGGPLVKVVPLDEWLGMMESKASLSNDDALRWASIRAFFNTGHVYWALDTSKTMETLRKLGIDTSRCPSVDMEYLKRLYHNWTLCPEHSKVA